MIINSDSTRTTRDGGEGLIAQAELLKLSESGEFSHEPAKIKGSQVHSGGGALPRSLLFICSRLKASLERTTSK
jgi:hypothetical protein